jgi:hypothetical protein
VTAFKFIVITFVFNNFKAMKCFPDLIKTNLFKKKIYENPNPKPYLDNDNGLIFF